MSKFTFLGTASAVPDQNQQNTHFVLETDERVILVDCVGNPIVRLEQAGIDPLSITDLVLTHFHPDHVSGVPLLLMDLWLMGRTRPVEIYGLYDVMDRFEKMMELYDWGDWTGFYPVNLHRFPRAEMMPLLETEDVKIWASSVCHMIPAIGLRMELPDGTVCYSTDTAACEAVIRLAEAADILIHEATGSSDGHSSAAEAGQIAMDAGVKKLVLIHYPPKSDLDVLKRQAQSTFTGEVIVARDLMQLMLD